MALLMKEILSRRSLIRELVLKDLKIRYSRPILGFFWSFLSPLLVVAIFYIVFSLILKVKTEEAPFILYLMTAVFTWRFFQDSLFSSTTSLVDNKNLVKEASFPHYLIPISIVLANLLNFMPSLVIIIAIAAFILKGLPIFISFLPIVLFIHLMLTMGLSIALSIVYVKWRDIKYILEAALLLLFYLTPVFYSIYLVKDSFPNLLFKAYIYNPFVGILNMYRVTLLRGFYKNIQNDIGFFSLTIIPFAFAATTLVLGCCLYKKNKNSINDYLSY